MQYHTDNQRRLSNLFQGEQVWHQANIHLVVASTVVEPAANQNLLRVFTNEIPWSAVHLLRPNESQADGTIHVYYVHRMEANGIFRGIYCIFVQDEAKLLPVPGGKNEPIPRVTAHELGHAFGLEHREALTNLMASGTTGILLNDEESRKAREFVRAFNFAEPIPNRQR